MSDGANVGDALALRETDDALLVELENEEVWVPKSVIHDDSEVYENGQVGDLVVKTWWAEKKGLIK